MWNFDKWGGKTAIIAEDGREVSYADLGQASAEMASRIPRRCLTFALCSNRIGSLLGYISFLNARIVPFLADVRLNRPLFHKLIERYQPDYLWVPTEISGDFPDYPSVHSVFGYSLLKTRYNAAFPLNDDLALLLTTSGSTGSPKFVRQSYRNLQANTESIVACLALDAAERPITTMPMSYTYGLSILNTHLHVGASIILTEKALTQKEFWSQFKDFQATSFGGVPYTYAMLDRLRFYRMALPSLRSMTQAGGKLPPELHKRFADFAVSSGKKFIVMYGQTEATARMSYLPAAESSRKCGSIGIAIPGGRLSLLSPEDTPITAPDAAGELIYEGDNVALGYAESGVDLNRGDDWGGLLRTGDVALRDAEGYYYICGRRKRFLKVFGNRINLDEMEQLLGVEFRGFECACSGRDDLVYIHITAENRATEVLNYVVGRTSLPRTAFKVNVVSRIPKNEAGKTNYGELGQHHD